MALLTIVAAEVAVLEDRESFTGPEGETLTVGQMVRYNTTTGKIDLGKATDAAEARKGGMVVKREGNGVVTVLRRGIVDVGDALSALTYDDDVHLSDTDGRLADAAGSTANIVATVVPIWSNPSAVADKALRIEQ